MERSPFWTHTAVHFIWLKVYQAASFGKWFFFVKLGHFSKVKYQVPSECLVWAVCTKSCWVIMKQVPPESQKVCQVLCRICLELLKLKKPSHSSVMGITRNLYDKCRESGKPVFLTFNFLFLILFEPFTSGKINYNEKRSMSSSSFRDWLFRCPYSWQYSVVSLTSSLSPFWGCIWHATLPLFLITQKIHSFPL